MARYAQSWTKSLARGSGALGGGAQRLRCAFAFAPLAAALTAAAKVGGLGAEAGAEAEGGEFPPAGAGAGAEGGAFPPAGAGAEGAGFLAGIPICRCTPVAGARGAGRLLTTPSSRVFCFLLRLAPRAATRVNAEEEDAPEEIL